MRLNPPEIPFDASLIWLLRSAFALTLEHSSPAAPRGVLGLARKLELSGRVAQRWRAIEGNAELRELAAALREDYLTNLAVETSLGNCLKRAIEVSNAVGVPLIALKYAALSGSGLIEPGTRVVGDIDVLVPRGQAEALWRALLRAGFSNSGSGGYPHQLEPLVDPYGAVLEIHLHLPGVFVTDQHPATADALLSRVWYVEPSARFLFPSPTYWRRTLWRTGCSRTSLRRKVIQRCAWCPI